MEFLAILNYFLHDTLSEAVIVGKSLNSSLNYHVKVKFI